VSSIESAAAAPRVSALAPFQVRSFRYQFPADVATSWAFEMENIILGWYVLVETQSVLMLTIYASLTFIGTLFAPIFGTLGDRLGHRNVLCGMRVLYFTLAFSLMCLSFLGMLNPILVLVFVGMHGMVRPSDIGMRSSLIGENIPSGQLIGAMGIQRTSQDTARIAGALTGAGLIAILGMTQAYAVVALFYAISFFLTREAGSKAVPMRTRSGPAKSPWRDLKEGLAYVWNTPHLLAVMLFAFLLNATAFPLFMSLLPVVAKNVYGSTQTTLGYMVACGAFGALLGSLVMSRWGLAFRPGRVMLGAGAGWLAMVLVLAHTVTPAQGMPILVLGGFAQSVGLVMMSSILLRNSDPQYRGRVMGIRMLAIYGNVPGLLLSAPLISAYGYAWTATAYCIFGLAFTALIAVVWRAELWRSSAATNAR
jgi:MFS family permease